ncbi:MAG: type II toxin-antitoxin system RelE/ParE family toxin [Reyranellaceae bacterium]
MPARFHSAAHAELVSARDWYENARTGLGDEFAAEVERVMTMILARPERFPFHVGETRRASLRRFPFSIFFENVDGFCHVWAVFHHRRDPSTVAQRFMS